ncbi:pilus assembly protein PilM [Patescibacteria group bacterium]
MALFGSHESFLGIDIGNSAVKLVELENVKGRPKLITYGYIEQANEILTSDTKEAKDKIIAALQKIQSESRTTSTNAVAALPSYTVFTSIIHLPEMPKKELIAAVNSEAKKFVPMPLEEMILDWKILEDGELSSDFSANDPDGNGAAGKTQAGGDQKKATIRGKKQKFLKILLTAAPQDLVSRYLEVFKAAKLNLVSLETESFALERALIGNDKSPIMLIDVGARATTISVVVESVPLINRSIDIGGQTITKAIANSMNIDEERAEQFKRDFGLAEKAGASDQVPQRIEHMVESIVNEVRYVLNLYQSQGNGTVEKIVLAGGSAWLPNITQYLSNVLGVKVFIGDPWARVMYPLEMKPVLQSLGPRMAVSIGLAMREIS